MKAGVSFQGRWGKESLHGGEGISNEQKAAVAVPEQVVVRGQWTRQAPHCPSWATGSGRRNGWVSQTSQVAQGYEGPSQIFRPSSGSASAALPSIPTAHPSCQTLSEASPLLKENSPTELLEKKADWFPFHCGCAASAPTFKCLCGGQLESCLYL